MTDPNLAPIVGVTEGELRLANHFLAASLASMKDARHFVYGSTELEARMHAIEFAIRDLHRDIKFIRDIAAAPANQVGHVTTSPVTQRPDGTYEQHSHGGFSGPLRNAQNIPKPETT